MFRLAPALYLIWALPLLLVIAWLTPAWQVADEAAHFSRAAQVAEGGMVGVRRGMDYAGGKVPGGIEIATVPFLPVPTHYDQKVTPEMLAAGSGIWGPREFDLFPNTAQYPPFFYVPDALAIRVGLHWKWAVVDTLCLARMLNAGAAAAVTMLALYFARRTRIGLLCLASLPMTLSLFASASQDALLLATSFLAVGLLDRVIAAERDARPWEMWLLAGLLVLLGTARPPYIAAALLALLATRRVGRPVLMVTGGVMAAVLLWSAFVAWKVSVPFFGIEPGVQLRFLLQGPAAACNVLIQTFARQSGYLWKEAIGQLGWLDTPMQDWYYLLADIVLPLALVAALGGRSRRFWVPLVCAAGTVVALALAEWLTWTQPGEPVVAGLQGRYFIAVLALLPLGMPGLPALRRFVLPPALLGAAALALATPYEIIRVLVLRFYLH